MGRQPDQSDSSADGRKGRLFVLGTHALLYGMQIRNEEHCHYSASLLLARGAPFRLRADGDWMTLRGVLVRPGVAQQLDARDDQMLIVQVDPDSSEYMQIAAPLEGRSHLPLDDRTLDRLLALTPQRPQTLCQAQYLLGGCVRVLAAHDDGILQRDPRVSACLRLLAETLDQPLPPAKLAALNGMSESRLQHLFKKETGVSMRRYLLWLRLQRAVVALAGGESLTVAAHEAGFADSAHFSRSFRGMFGLPPSLLLKDSSYVQVSIAAPEQNMTV